MPTSSFHSREKASPSFYDLQARAFRRGHNAVAEAIQLSDNIAHVRNYAVQLVTQEGATIEEVVDTTAPGRTEQTSLAERFKARYGDEKRHDRLTNIVTMQGMFIDHMVLTPALMAYGVHDREARQTRQDLNIGLYEALGAHALQFNPKRLFTSGAEKLEQTVSIREVVLFALGARSENPDMQVMPALFRSTDQDTHAEFFAYSNAGVVQHAAVHLTSTEETIPDDLQNILPLTTRDLGLGSSANPWRHFRINSPTLVALQKEYNGEANTVMGHHNVTVGDGLNSVEQNVISVLRGALTLYDLEEPVAPPA